MKVSAENRGDACFVRFCVDALVIFVANQPSGRKVFLKRNGVDIMYFRNRSNSCLVRSLPPPRDLVLFSDSNYGISVRCPPPHLESSEGEGRSLCSPSARGERRIMPHSRKLEISRRHLSCVVNFFFVFRSLLTPGKFFFTGLRHYRSSSPDRHVRISIE